MHALVRDVALYPQFLPWCDYSAVLASDAHSTTAQLGINYFGLKQRFTTRNTSTNQAPDVWQLSMQLVQGPFSQLQGQWLFTPVGTAQQGACKVALSLQYDFDNPALAALVGPVFDVIASSLVDAFVKRAEQVYG